MDLHELMGTAVADLPELPDQLGQVERIHHRRTATKRASLISVGTALVLGVGTLTIASPWAHQATNRVAAGSAPITRQQFAEDAARILQQNWPVSGQQVVWKATPATGPSSQIFIFEVEQGTKVVGGMQLIFYGSGSTTPYPMTTLEPLDCLNWPQMCTADAAGDRYVSISTGDDAMAFVYSGNDPIYSLTDLGVADLKGVNAPSPQLVVGGSLTRAQMQHLGASDGLREIYAEAARAGQLTGSGKAAPTDVESS